MKPIMKIFERLRPNFQEGGKLKTFKAVFEAMENFFFSPDARTVTAPHLRDPLDLKRYMSMVIVGLLPALMAGFYFNGPRLLAVILVSYMAGGAVEVAFAAIRKEEIHEGFLVTGLIFPMVLPAAIPLWMVAVGVAFGVFVGKELFGGVGRNVFNPAIVGRCFLALAYPLQMGAGYVDPGTAVTGRLLNWVGPGHDAISGATPLGLAKQGAWGDVALLDMFLGRIGGSAAETCTAAIIIGGVILLLTKVANWRTVLGVLGSAAVMAVILTDSIGEAAWQMCAGGLMFGAFFMATDPVSSASTDLGKLIYGIIIGTVIMLIRNFTGYVEGVMFAILLGNIVAPIIDAALYKVRFRRLQVEG